MLKARLLTILVALPLFLIALFYLPGPGFAVFTGVLMGLIAWEWSGLVPFTTITRRAAMILAVIAMTALTFVIPILYWLLAAVLFWLWASVSVITYAVRERALGLEKPLIRFMFSLFMLPPFWISMNILRNTSAGPWLLLFVLGLVWSVDTGAYIVGRRFGKHLLIPSVSPKKSWEGLAGGVGLAMVLVLSFCLRFHLGLSQSLYLFALCFVTILFAVMGDLFESLLKRQVDIKDSGNLLPGHGGFFDRFDSVIAALPIFALGMLVLM